MQNINKNTPSKLVAHFNVWVCLCRFVTFRSGYFVLYQHWRGFDLRLSSVSLVKVKRIKISWCVSNQSVFTMASFQALTNRKQICVILSLIKLDCIDLYQTFRTNKVQLKSAIESYEEFMTDEINTIFRCNKNFSDIVLKHRNQFKKFVGEILKQISINSTSQANVVSSSDDSVYVIFISVQEWLTQGPKGQEFLFVIDIDSFNLSKLMKCQQPANATQKVRMTEFKQSQNHLNKVVWHILFL